MDAERKSKVFYQASKQVVKFVNWESAFWFLVFFFNSRDVFAVLRQEIRPRLQYYLAGFDRTESSVDNLLYVLSKFCFRFVDGVI